MPQSRFTWTLVLVGSFLLGVTWIIQSRDSVQQNSAAAATTEAPIAGYRAPDFTLQTLAGETVTLSELQGQAVVLNFWATWCPPCRAEIPFFQEASRKYNGQVAILGIDDGESPDTVAPFVAELRMTYPIPLDRDGVVSRQYGVNSLPSTFFVDGRGIIRKVHIGIINQGLLEEQIGRLLAQ